jgi:serine/threonine protein kinase
MISTQYTGSEAFARKVLEIAAPNAINRDKIDERTTIMKTVCQGSRHIVEILGHGMLRENVYFIDMELCALNLSDYISWEPNHTPIVGLPEWKNAVKAQTITILEDILQGLSFLHHSDIKQHGNLKPQNGIPSF